VVHTASPLPEGQYQLTINPSVLADQAGNAITSSLSLTFTSFDLDEQNAVAWVSDTDGDWNNAGNWSTGRVPGANDTVILDRKTANPTIRITSGDIHIHGLIARENVVLAGGSLTVTGSSNSTRCSRSAAGPP